MARNKLNPDPQLFCRESWGYRATDEARVDPPAQRHSTTSVAAAKSMTPSKAQVGRAKVLLALKDRGEAGATDQELQQATGLRGNTQRPRRIELSNAGLVKNSGKMRKTITGHMATVWVAVDE